MDGWGKDNESGEALMRESTVRMRRKRAKGKGIFLEFMSIGVYSFGIMMKFLRQRQFDSRRICFEIRASKVKAFLYLCPICLCVSLLDVKCGYRKAA